MRSLLVSVALLVGLAFAPPAQAERKMFIINADTGGYGVDRCLATGAACGAPAAAAYCRRERNCSLTLYFSLGRSLSR